MGILHTLLKTFNKAELTYMKKTVIALLSLTGVAMGAGGTATLGDGITGTWTEYNKQDYITTSSNSISFGGEDWGGATAWITLADTVTLGKDQVLTFSYTLEKTVPTAYIALVSLEQVDSLRSLSEIQITVRTM